MPTAVDLLYSDLINYVGELDDTFIKQYLNDPLADPNVYKHFVRAYCVLCHAAIEEYFEEVAKKVMLHCIEAWTTRRVLNDSLLALIGHYPKEIKDDDDKKVQRSFDYLRNLLEETKAKFSHEIHNNNGADIYYLKKLLEPIAVDISNDPTQMTALSNLAKQRGEFAHTGVVKARITTILSPDDAKTYVYDCLKLCDEVKINANSRLI